MSNITITSNTYIPSQNLSYLSENEADSKVWGNDINSRPSLDNPASKPGVPGSGIWSKDEWLLWLWHKGFINRDGDTFHPGTLAFYYGMGIQELLNELNKNKPFDYDRVLDILNKALAKLASDYGMFPGLYTELSAILNQIKFECGLQAKADIEKNISLIDSYKKALRSYLESASPADRILIEALLQNLDAQRIILSDMLRDPADFTLYEKLALRKGEIASLLSSAEQLFYDLAHRKDEIPEEEEEIVPPPPASDIPLAEGESVRNQTRRRGLGNSSIGAVTGAVTYLQAFYKFSQTCNKLISMNANWGMELANLQKDASRLNISCQESISALIRKELASFNKDITPSKITEIQSRGAAAQADFAAYQKSLDSIAPLVLEQPKNITKDLDKFLEAAKSILQMITAYANFRI